MSSDDRPVTNERILTRSGDTLFPVGGTAEAAANVIEHLLHDGATGISVRKPADMHDDWYADVEQIVCDWCNSASITVNVAWQDLPGAGRSLFFIRDDHQTWTPT